MVVVAQLVRALVCGAGGRGFESHHPPNKKGVENQLLFFILKFQAIFFLGELRGKLLEDIL